MSDTYPTYESDGPYTGGYYEIPVVFVVLGENERAAAERLVKELMELVNPKWFTQEGNVNVDSWFMPNHRYADGNDLYPGQRLSYTYDYMAGEQ